MRFEVTDSFKRDFGRLKGEHKEMFRHVVRTKFADACDGWAEATDARRHFVWPKSLRVDEMVGAPGIMEMTWSYASPDGRATFMLVRRGEVFVCVWRRIGDHSVYDSP